MKSHFLAAASSGPVDLSHPGTYLHWSIFEISVANLIVIAVMVALFGAALLPFPRGQVTGPAAEAGTGPGPGGPDSADPAPDAVADGDERMWTARARRRALRLLLLVPFIPGLRDIPRWIPVHRLIWRA